MGRRSLARARGGPRRRSRPHHRVSPRHSQLQNHRPQQRQRRIPGGRGGRPPPDGILPRRPDELRSHRPARAQSRWPKRPPAAPPCQHGRARLRLPARHQLCCAATGLRLSGMRMARSLSLRRAQGPLRHHPDLAVEESLSLYANMYYRPLPNGPGCPAPSLLPEGWYPRGATQPRRRRRGSPLQHPARRMEPHSRLSPRRRQRRPRHLRPASPARHRSLA